MKKLIGILCLSLALIISVVSFSSCKKDSDWDYINSVSAMLANEKKSLSSPNANNSTLPKASNATNNSSSAKASNVTNNSTSAKVSQSGTTNNSTSVKTSQSASTSNSASTVSGGVQPTVKFAAENPIIDLTINTSSGDVESKIEYVTGKIAISSNTGSSILSKQDVSIRGRGNTTWTFEKKAYRLKFKNATNLLSMGASQHWILLANMCDRTYIRNELGLTLSKQLNNLPFTPEYKPVEVYLNNEYRGAYLLVEAIKVDDDGRINISTEIDKDPEDVGYLIELSKNKTAEDDAIMFDDKLSTSTRKNSYEIHNDLGSGSRETAQIAYIKGYVDDCLDAILTKNQTTISNLIDIDSAVDAYILEETLGNMDVGWDSFYFIKDGASGKLEFGPLWDYDVSMGNGNDASKQTTGFHACDKGFDQENLWFYNLMQCDWFRIKVKTRWNSINSQLNALKSNVTTFSNASKKCFERDRAFWGNKLTKPVNTLFENTALNSYTYQEQVTYLNNWLTNRISWLNTEINKSTFSDIETDLVYATL